jgi:hypothetical protein
VRRALITCVATSALRYGQVSANEAPCGSAAPQTKQNEFVFDATSGILAAPPKPVRARSDVTLRVINPNGFREHYVLVLTGHDYHALSIPAGLSGILQAYQEQVTEVTQPAAEHLLVIAPQFPCHRPLVEPFEGSLHSVEGVERRIVGLSAKADQWAGHVNDDRIIGLELQTVSTNTKARRAILDRFLAIEKDVGIADGEVSDNTQCKQRAREGGRVNVLLAEVEAWKDSVGVLKQLVDGGAAVKAWRAAFESTKPEGRNGCLGAVNGWVEGRTKDWQASVKRSGEVFEAAEGAMQRLTSLLTFALFAAEADDELTLTAHDVDQDLIEASVTVVPNGAPKDSNGSSNGPPPVGSRKSTKSVRVIGRWTIDVTAGLAVGNLREHGYFAQAVVDTPKAPVQIHAGGGDQFDIGPALLGNLLWHPGSDLGLGCSIGIVTASPVRYLAGVTAEYGERYRVAFTFGVEAGDQTVLQGQKLGEVVPASVGLRTRSAIQVETFGAISFALLVPKSN